MRRHGVTNCEEGRIFARLIGVETWRSATNLGLIHDGPGGGRAGARIVEEPPPCSGFPDVEVHGVRRRSPGRWPGHRRRRPLLEVAYAWRISEAASVLAQTCGCGWAETITNKRFDEKTPFWRGLPGPPLGETAFYCPKVLVIQNTQCA